MYTNALLAKYDLKVRKYNNCCLIMHMYLFLHVILTGDSQILNEEHLSPYGFSSHINLVKSGAYKTNE